MTQSRNRALLDTAGPRHPDPPAWHRPQMDGEEAIPLRRSLPLPGRSFTYSRICLAGGRVGRMMGLNPRGVGT